MLCGETLCGDKFLFSFLPLHIATSMSMHFNNRVRKPVVCIDTCIYMQRGKENTAWSSMLIGWRYGRAAIHHARAEKSCMPISTANQHRDPEILFVTCIYLFPVYKNYFQIPKMFFKNPKIFHQISKYFTKFQNISSKC